MNTSSIYLLRHSLLYSPHVTQPLHHCITATQNRITTDDAIRYSQPPSLPAAKGIEGGRKEGWVRGKKLLCTVLEEDRTFSGDIVSGRECH